MRPLAIILTLLAINYGWLTLQHEWGDALNLPIAILLILRLVLSFVSKRRQKS